MIRPTVDQAQRDKWNTRYRSAQAPGSAAAVLIDNLHLLPRSGKALDLACGLGANALLLAQAGLHTCAWDIADEALRKLQSFAAAVGVAVNTEQRDAESNPPAPGSFDVIVVSRFLYRPLCAALIDALTPGGLLFYQTFTQQKVSPEGPDNPAFLLRPGELLFLFKPLSTIAYREESDCGNIELGLRNQAYYIGRKTG